MSKEYLERITDQAQKQGELGTLLEIGAKKHFEVDDTDPDAKEFVTQHDFIDSVKEARSKWGRNVGLNTGIKQIDDLTYGFEVGELVILGGFAGLGKTALMIHAWAEYARQHTLPTFVTMEITHEQLFSRLDMYADDAAELALISQKKQLIERHDVKTMIENAVEAGSKVIFVDYLQLLTMDDKEEHRAIGRILRELKNYAIEHKLLIFVISALNRGANAGEELEVHNLKGSSFIEFFADVILLFQYNVDKFAMDIRVPELKIAKNRNRKLDWENRKREIAFDGRKFT